MAYRTDYLETVLGSSFDIFFCTYSIIEQLFEDNQNSRYSQSDKKENHIFLLLLISIYQLRCPCFLHHCIIRGVGGFTYLCLRPFLQQECIITVIYLISAFVIEHSQLFVRCFHKEFVQSRPIALVRTLLYLIDITYGVNQLVQLRFYLTYLRHNYIILRIFDANVE